MRHRWNGYGNKKNYFKILMAIACRYMYNTISEAAVQQQQQYEQQQGAHLYTDEI
jgi:hypothetical protein